MRDVARHLGEYALMGRIGGSMRSEVTRARHRTLGHIVAIKRLLPHAQEAPEERQRFNEECALMLDLSTYGGGVFSRKKRF